MVQIDLSGYDDPCDYELHGGCLFDGAKFTCGGMYPPPKAITLETYEGEILRFEVRSDVSDPEMPKSDEYLYALVRKVTPQGE